MMPGIRTDKLILHLLAEMVRSFLTPLHGFPVLDFNLDHNESDHLC